MPTLAFIQIGRPQSFPADDAQPLSKKPWRTAFFKTPITGLVEVGPEGIKGDGQADLKHHGGVDKAICAYSVQHFEYWKNQLDRTDFGAGGFGENFSVEGLDESDVAIGDRWKIGTVTFEISQPRQPCWKLARRWQVKSMTPQSIKTGKTGWYLRTIEPGKLRAGDEINVQTFVSSQHSRITIAEANDIFYRKQADKDATRRLISMPPLSQAWRTELQNRLS